MSTINENGCLETTAEELKEYQQWYDDLTIPQRRRILALQLALCELGYGKDAPFRMLECHKKAVEQLKKEIALGVQHDG